MGGFIASYIFVLFILYLLGSKVWPPLFVVFQFLFRSALGAAGIYLFNLWGAGWQLSIPLNPFNAIFTGFLGIPGLAALFVMCHFLKI